MKKIDDIKISPLSFDKSKLCKLIMDKMSFIDEHERFSEEMSESYKDTSNGNPWEQPDMTDDDIHDIDESIKEVFMDYLTADEGEWLYNFVQELGLNGAKQYMQDHDDFKHPEIIYLLWLIEKKFLPILSIF